MRAARRTLSTTPAGTGGSPLCSGEAAQCSPAPHWAKSKGGSEARWWGAAPQEAAGPWGGRREGRGLSRRQVWARESPRHLCVARARVPSKVSERTPMGGAVGPRPALDKKRQPGPVLYCIREDRVLSFPYRLGSGLLLLSLDTSQLGEKSLPDVGET